MYAAITTKFVGPTNVRGSRVVADAGDKRRLIVSWDHSLNSENNHRAAALALRDKLGWTGDLVGGWHENIGLWVFVDSPYGPKHPGLTCQYCGTANVCCEHCYHNKPGADRG